MDGDLGTGTGRQCSWTSRVRRESFECVPDLSLGG